MKIIATGLRREMAKKEISVCLMVKKINELQLKAGNNKGITRQTLYDYFHGVSTPPQDRMYVICAILGIKPKKIFEVKYNSELYEKYLTLNRRS